jgi:MYXO-CTERM domain-containing protein
MTIRSPILVLGAVLAAVLAWSSTAHAQVSPPYMEGFDSEPNCGTSCTSICTLSTTGWLNEPTLDDLDWLVDNSTTGSSSTGPSVDHTTGMSSGKYLYTEASGCSFSTSWLWSPPIDLTTSVFPYARFWRHMYGSNMGTMHVDIEDGTSTLILDVIPPYTDNLNAWQVTPDIDLSAYVGQTIRVRIRGIRGNGFRSDMAIDDFELFQILADDVGVTSIDAPVSDCGLINTENVAVTLSNGGGNAQSNFDVSYSLDGGAPVVETFTGTINALQSAQFVFATPADLSGPGPHTLSVSVTLIGDQDPGNDTVLANVDNRAVVSAFPSADDFEGGSGLNWIVGGTNSSWQLGTPANTVINSAFSGANAYVTNLTGPYSNNETSFVETQHCYDFSANGAPVAALAIWYETESGFDGAVLQSTIDNGQSWQVVGALNDPLNWYNETSLNGNPGGQGLGWANTSGGWLMAEHPMFNLGGQPRVRFRVAFGSEGSVTDEGVAFDDFAISALIDDELRVTHVGPTSGSLATYQPSQSDILAQSLELSNWGPASSLPVDAITITNPGSLADADIVAVKLWSDDGDNVFNPAVDTLIDTQVVAAGTATFNATGVTASNVAFGRIFISYDLGANAPASATFGSNIANPLADIVSAAADIIAAQNLLDGPLLVVGAIVNMLPYADDLSGVQPNRTVVFQTGTSFPQATVVGPISGMSVPTGNDALVQLLADNAGLLPVDGTSFFAMSFPNGPAVGALDYGFDLSAYMAANDRIWVQYRFADAGEEDDAEDNIFLSLDGGASWAASLVNFDWSEPVNNWSLQSVDVSDALVGLGLDYTNDVLIRFQAGDDQALNGDGLLIDSVVVGRAMRTQVERPLNFNVDDEGAEVLGNVPLLAQTLTYTIRNTGDLPLVVDGNSFQTNNVNNVQNITITPPVNDVIDGGMTETFAVDYLGDLGAYDFEVAFSVNDPELSDNIYNFDVSGVGVPAEPEIDIQRPVGTSLADGASEPQGSVMVAQPQTLAYEILNEGFVDLNITGVSILASTNVDASVTMAPADFTMAGDATQMTVTYTVSDNGPFNFDIVVANNDLDEPLYTLVVSGEGTGSTSGTGGMGGAGMGGQAAGGDATGGAGTGGAGVGGDGGDDVGPAAEGDGGCGCRVVGGDAPNRHPLGGIVLLLGLGLALGRRRRGAA